MSYYAARMPEPLPLHTARATLPDALRATACAFLHLYIFGYEDTDAAEWAGWMMAAAFELEEPSSNLSFPRGEGKEYFATRYVKRLANDASALDQPTPTVRDAAAFAADEDFLYLLKQSVETCIALAEVVARKDDGYPAVILAGLRQTLADLRRQD